MTNHTPLLRVATRFHGEVIVSAQSIWKCHAPIRGFNADREYFWLPHPTRGLASPFSVFQSLRHPTLAFIVIGLTLTDDLVGLPEFLEGYGLTGPAHTWQAWAICTTYPDGRPTTVNLRAPLLFHPKTRRGGQIVLDDARFSFEYPLEEPPTRAVGLAAP